MDIKVSSALMKGSRIIRENRLPIFRSKSHSKAVDDSLLLPEEREGYGYETGDRILPYLRQDDYSRSIDDVVVKTIVMENDLIRAEFWPEFGMRLVSLFLKKDNKELLFHNKALRIADLAIRRAWFSGGIEWNIGQLGHTFTTCDDLFVSIMEADGVKFIRCYEYERCKGLYWSVDFHLRDGDDFLSCYARIVNRKDVPVPFYWWTNTAVPEVKGLRVFSGSPEIIYIHPASLADENAAKCMAHGTLPYIPAVKDGVDFSYPENFTDYSNEYFFQNEASLDETWEAASYPDGWIFFDRSSEMLRYRKMFCWGGLKGGRHWRDYLSLPGEGDYVELQAGFARTQMHGMDIPGSCEWDFVQFFGGAKLGVSCCSGEWDESRSRVYDVIDSIVPQSLVSERLAEYRRYRNIRPDDLIHIGSGFGALEELREPGITPDGFFFPLSSISEKEEPWLLLLQEGIIDDAELPSSFIVDERWLPLLRKAAAGGKNCNALNLLGVLLLENGDADGAEEAFSEALGIRENAFSLRNLAQVWIYRGDISKAIDYMGRCCKLSKLREYAAEYISLLVEAGEDDKAWEYYDCLDDDIKDNERVWQEVLPSALALNKLDFLEKAYSREPSTVREGKRVYSDGYFEYQAMLEAKRTGVPYSQALVEKYRKEDTIPLYADFRQG